MLRHTLFLFAFALLAACQQAPTPPAPPAAPAAPETPARELRHVVLFKFKDGLSADTIHSIETAFKNLKSQIPSIRHFEWGTNNSPEQLAQGFTHCFLVTFASEKDRDEYLPCAAHQAFVNTYAKPYVDKVCVVDFWAK